MADEPTSTVKVDLREVEVTVGPREDPADAVHRRSQELEDAKLRRHRELVVFYVGVVFLVVTASAALFNIAASTNQETIKWSQTILTAYASAFVGFLVGKSQK